MSLKAIPTTYANVDFRSRLEARVALMLDTHDIEWRYESEGYELSDGSRYLPDFFLPQIRTYIEVKGDHGERTEKPRQFAIDLTGWNERGFGVDADNNLDQAWMHPVHMVLIMGIERHWSGTGERPSIINALGASTIAIECDGCGTRQWINIGGFRCRACTADLTWDAYYRGRGGWGVDLEMPRLPQWRRRP